MKMQIPPPARLKTKYLHVFDIPGSFRGAQSVVAEVGAAYRHRRMLISEVQRELIRFSAMLNRPVHFIPRGEMAPYPIFARQTVDQWLDDGGRAWIVAELEARSSRRVVAFPTKKEW